MSKAILNYDVDTSSRSRKPEAWYELACRRAGGTVVRLYWKPRGDEIFVHVKDESSGEDFVLEPPSSSALAAFYHPYALRGPEWP
jgi:hypothetical protein